MIIHPKHSSVITLVVIVDITITASSVMVQMEEFSILFFLVNY